MNKSHKYDTSGLVEAQFEPGSRGRVLKNLLGIKKKRAMDILEAREQYRVLVGLPEEFDINQRFTANDICIMHKEWLGAIYSWAGKRREYFFAVRKGLLRDYGPMAMVFRSVIAGTLKIAKKKHDGYFGGGTAPGFGFGDGTGQEKDRYG